MKKIILILPLLALFLTGCGLSTREIVEKKQDCLDKGMEFIEDWSGYVIVDIVCITPELKDKK